MKILTHGLISVLVSTCTVTFKSSQSSNNTSSMKKTAITLVNTVPFEKPPSSGQHSPMTPTSTLASYSTSDHCQKWFLFVFWLATLLTKGAPVRSSGPTPLLLHTWPWAHPHSLVLSSFGATVVYVVWESACGWVLRTSKGARHILGPLLQLLLQWSWRHHLLQSPAHFLKRGRGWWANELSQDQRVQDRPTPFGCASSCGASRFYSLPLAPQKKTAKGSDPQRRCNRKSPQTRSAKR